MEIQIPFVFVSLFSFASVVLLLIFKFGIKEKSYEEALAEQRQQTHTLLGIKPRLRERKNKKPSKKGPKERMMIEENEAINESEHGEPSQKNVDTQKKLHVEFKESTEDVTSKSVTSKKHTKKDKVRPILVHKENLENDPEKATNCDGTSYSGNKFEEMHPKDDFELFRAASVNLSEEAVKEEPERNPEIEVPKPTTKKSSEPEAACVIKESAALVSTAPVNGFIGNTGKEKKKKKSEFNNLQQQLVGDSNGPNITALLTLVRKAELSRSEVQILIDLLLNKQHEAPAVIDEWSEGKSDPLQKLKKQFAEKEKLLLEEQQALVNAQAKLKEIRSEHQSEKNGLLRKLKNLEEILNQKQTEASRLQQQTQQIQNQLTEEIAMGNKLREDIGALQKQRQQCEMIMAKAQDSEAVINQLRQEYQELSTNSSQLHLELQRLTAENLGEKERNMSLIDQLNSVRQELTERNRQLEENQRQNDHDFETVLKRENALKVDLSGLNSVIQKQNEEIRRLEHSVKQYQDDLQKHKDESNKMITQLTAELRQAQEEKRQIQVTHMNGSPQENKQHEVEILNLHNELSSVKTQLTQVEEQNKNALKDANAETEKLQRELEEMKNKLDEEKLKFEAQKSKNNDLRERNWKVMEALNAAESRIKSNSPNVKTKSEEDIQHEFIQRLFPEIKDQDIVNAQLFKTNGEQFIRNYIENLRKSSSTSDVDSEQTKLELEIQHYKEVIDSTEKMLNQLQKQIGQEEINWRIKLAEKSDELEDVKKCRQELQEKLTQTETELKKGAEDKKKLLAQLQQQCNNDAQIS